MTRTNWFRILPVVLLAMAVMPDATSAQHRNGMAAGRFPHAARDAQTDSYHGVRVADPYRWMEDLNSENLHTWMRAQDSLRAAYLGENGLARQIAARIKALGRYALNGAPVQKGSHVFQFRRDVDDTWGAYYVWTTKNSEARMLLDMKTLNHDSLSASRSSFSPDGRYLTYNTRVNQSRWQTVRVLRVSDGRLMPDVIDGYYGGRSNLAWSRDGSGFYYARYEKPEDPQAPLGLGTIVYHKIGTSQEEDVPVYSRPDIPQLSWSLRTTEDGRYLIISGSMTGGTFNGMYDRLFYRYLGEPESEVRELFAGMDGSWSFEGSSGDRFWIRTSDAAARLRLVEVDVTNPAREHWREILPEATEAIQAVSVISERFVVQYIKDARSLARVFDLDGRLQFEVDHVSPNLSGLTDDPHTPFAYYRTGILFDPGTLYKLNVHTGKEEIYFRPELQHDPDDFVIRQEFYPSKDGTRVPMFLLHRKGLQRDGTNPVFMYGYGAWAWAAFPWQGYMMPWMEMGGIYAVANIRGGGEYGESWHQDGIRRKKQSGIDDFIAGAEWLIENGYTTSARMIANGGSASGILPAVAVVQRPDLFGASVINFPALDMLRYEKFGSAKSWIPEFGTAQDPEDFKALLAYSPYHNVKKGVCYPPTWVQVGENDVTTTPMHGYKFVAALQAAQACDQPLLLKIAWGAGHSYGLTPEQSRMTQAEELAFLVKVLGMDVAGWK